MRAFAATTAIAADTNHSYYYNSYKNYSNYNNYKCDSYHHISICCPEFLECLASTACDLTLNAEFIPQSNEIRNIALAAMLAVAQVV